MPYFGHKGPEIFSSYCYLFLLKVVLIFNKFNYLIKLSNLKYFVWEYTKKIKKSHLYESAEFVWIW